MGNLLAIDLGTSSVKVVVTSANGRVLSRGVASYPIHNPQSGFAQQDPEEWWESLRAAISQAMNAGEIARESVEAIGLTGQMHGTLLLDAHGKALTQAIIWPDRRGAQQAAEINRYFGIGRLMETAGSPAAAGFQAATLLWYKQNRPQIWSRIGKVTLPKDYLRWRLSGRFTTDPGDASSTLLFDIKRRQWSPELLEITGLIPAQLPSIAASDTISSRLSKSAAAQLGLTADIPIATGSGDVACGLLGSGLTDDQSLLLTISTGGQLALPVSEPNVDGAGRIHTFCSALESSTGSMGYFQLGAILAAGLSLRWLRDQILGDSDRLSYDDLMEMAAQVPQGADGLLFLPYIAGARTPHMDSEAKGAFLGLTVQHGRREMVRAVLEGVAMACFDAFQVLAELGAAPSEIVMAGGGARSLLWRQIIADIFGLPVRTPLVLEQSAYGAAMLAGGGIGYHTLKQAASQWPEYEQPTLPDYIKYEQYLAQYELFKTAYSAAKFDSPKVASRRRKEGIERSPNLSKE
ncbi:MAG: xylulokinase [Candidatus Promineifilaceae bacterium]